MSSIGHVKGKGIIDPPDQDEAAGGLEGGKPPSGLKAHKCPLNTLEIASKLARVIEGRRRSMKRQRACSL